MDTLVFNYTNYRHFIRDYVEEKRQRNSAYSLEVLSRQTGCLSKSYLSLILNNKRDISAKKILPLAKALKLRNKGLSYFENLVMFNQAKDARDKEEFLRRLVQSRPKKLESNLEIDQYQVLENWHGMVIRELVNHPFFKEEPQQISQLLKEHLSPREAQRALDRLLKTKLLSRDERGRLQKTQDVLKSSDEVRSLALQRYHKSCLHLGQAVIDSEPVSEREFSSVTLLLSPSQFQEIKEKIKEFRDEIGQTRTYPDGGSKVCQLNIQFFPIG